MHEWKNLAVSIWVHTHGDLVLDGGGFPIKYLGHRAEKVSVWPTKEAAMRYFARTFKGRTIRDLGNRLEVDLPADAINPARTLAMIELNIS